jgi:hypothetical protein
MVMCRGGKRRVRRGENIKNADMKVSLDASSAQSINKNETGADNRNFATLLQQTPSDTYY